MSRKTLLLSLVAAMPALLWAQEPKLVNCRTLEAAGNFVGPDEVIVNDMVCQKAKAGAEGEVKPQAPKPVPGAVISDTDSMSVVEAAKAASKRTAAAREALKEKAEQKEKEQEEAPTPEITAPPAGNSEAPTAPAEPLKTPPAATPPVSAPAAKPQMNLPVKPPTPQVAATAEPTHEAAPMAAAPEAQAPTAQVAEPAAAIPTEVANAPAAESTASGATTAAAQPATAAEPAAGVKTNSSEEVSAPSPEAAAPAAPGATSAPAAAEAPKAAVTPAGQEGTGFYDANTGNNVAPNPRPEDTAKATFTAPEPTNPRPEDVEKAVGEPVTAPAEAAPRAPTPAEAEAQASLLAPDPNVPRDRVVETGSFAVPKEEGPDPAAEAHKTTFLPGDIEGFQEGQRPECTKNITLGGLKGEKLVLGTPGWAARWVEKNQKRMPQVCFSDTPMKNAKNYLIVFYTAPGNTSAAETSNNSLTPKGTPAGGVGAFTLSYGSTWHYAVDRTVGVTVLTRDETDQPYSNPGQVSYATAYTEEGMPLLEHWPEKPKKEVHVDEKNLKSKKARQAREALEQASDGLLSEMVDEIAKL